MLLNLVGCSTIEDQEPTEAVLPFDYSVRTMHFSGEEQGLVGNRNIARAMREDGARVVAMFNLDMSGWRLPNGRPITIGMKDRFVTNWLLSATDAVTRYYVPDLQVGRSPSCCSDHQAFFENGFPALGYFENIGGASDNPNYHRFTDTVDTLDFQNVELIGKAFFAGLLTFAVPTSSI